jgi:pimeloyl-ACP methyl ester carboxylesterase
MYSNFAQTLRRVFDRADGHARSDKFHQHSLLATMQMSRATWLGGALIASLLIQSGCTAENASKPAPTLALSECRVAGMDSAVQCAKLSVLENRETKAGRKIDLNIVVVAASAKQKLPDPIFIFAGGPGQAATDLVKLVAVMGTLNNKRDIVFIDQRGTGKSNLLNCKLPEDDIHEVMANPIKRRELTLKLYGECRDTLSAKADLTQYGTTAAMADYDDVRAALGYQTINLWGASYGSRSAMEYLRRYPLHVRSVTIDSVAAPSLVLPENFSRDAAAALEAMFVACEKSAKCAKNYPALRQDFSTVLAQLEKSPQRLQMKDPLTGVTKTTTISRDAIAMPVFSSLYAPQTAAMLPEAIHQAARGNYNVLSALSGGVGDLDKMALGMRLSVMCSEDLPRITSAMREAASRVAPFGDSFIREFSTACEVWPKGKVAADFYTPLQSDKPVLLLSGALDPVTPPSWAEEVKKTLPNSVHFIAPSTAHGTAHVSCAPKIVKEFIESASVAKLDGECLKKLPRPTFFQAMIDKDKSRDKSKDQDDKNNSTAGERK